MPPTIRFRSKDVCKINYQILDYDEVSGDVSPVDLTGMTVSASLIADESATYIVQNKACSMFDETVGQVSCEFSSSETATPGMYKLTFSVVSGGYTTTYPRQEYQWVLLI